MARPARRELGLTLIELLISVAIGALILAGLHSVLTLGLHAQSAGRTGNELVYQGRFALERMTQKARATPPKQLAAPSANTTGDWFAPATCAGVTCLMYCRNAASKLIETVSTDTGCTGGTVIASNVSALAASLPAGAGATDKPVATLSLTFDTSYPPKTVTLVTSVRLGGGTQ